ncbi:Sensory histidine kinase BaeS (plasmid) [Ralstonia solanacearum]|nr:Sensory histidine kinase BaeS [Ralstonia solanacearum]
MAAARIVLARRGRGRQSQLADQDAGRVQSIAQRAARVVRARLFLWIGLLAVGGMSCRRASAD